MPKIGDTRKDKAEALFKRVMHGPHFSRTGSEEFTPEGAIASYQRWAISWVLQDLVALVPELRGRDWYKEATEKKA